MLKKMLVVDPKNRIDWNTLLNYKFILLEADKKKVSSNEVQSETDISNSQVKIYILF